jgi:hypothetical protein
MREAQRVQYIASNSSIVASQFGEGEVLNERIGPEFKLMLEFAQHC